MSWPHCGVQQEHPQHVHLRVGYEGEFVHTTCPGTPRRQTEPEEYLPGERIRITFTATVVATDEDGTLLAQLDHFNGGYNFRVPPGATLQREYSVDAFEPLVQELTEAIIGLCYPEIVAKHLPPASRKVIENTARLYLKRAWNLGKEEPSLSDNWQDSPIMLAAAFEGMAENPARPIVERYQLALQAILHLHEHIDALEAAAKVPIVERNEP